MDTQTFEHNGVKYTVKPYNAFTVGHVSRKLVDVADPVLKARGYKKGIEGDYPNSIDYLLTTFVRWMYNTVIEGDVEYAINLRLATPDESVTAFDAWEKAILSDDTLSEKWQQAVNRANLEPEGDTESEKKAGQSG